MNVKETIEKRRSYRSLDPVDITDELIEDLAESAKLAPSCFNNQPWNYVFVHDEKKLEEVFNTLSSGNEWAKNASMVIGVFAKKEDDCNIKGREYYLFDTGLATSMLMLRARELGLVAHAIAGYSESKAKDVMSIPEEYRLITLVILGKHSEEIKDILSKKQAKDEKQRPPREDFSEFAYHNEFNNI
ncbi:MAG TPA: nitroreductase family protein [Halanaerobiales bacterium]|nr:nitroreductase family protein [Halanaerobiales bacterium]